MRFSLSTITTTALALLSTSNVAAQLTAPQVITNINTITTISQNLQVPANQINVLSPVIGLEGEGPFPAIIAGFSTIVSNINGDVVAMQTPVTFSGQDATNICAAFTDFVGTHQALLMILVGKRNLLDTLGVASPIAQSIESVRSGLDTIAISLAGMVPVCANQISAQTTSLDTEMATAISAYSGIPLKKRTSRFKA